jgi:hypothetical protein
MMNGVDRHARKQVLLARIAFSRNELRHDIAQVKRAAQPAQLLHAVVGDGLGATLGRTVSSLFGRNASLGDWFGTATAWLSRYRIASSLLGSVLPMLGGGRGLRRLLKIAAIAGTGWLGWRTLSSRRRQP